MIVMDTQASSIENMSDVPSEVRTAEESKEKVGMFEISDKESEEKIEMYEVDEKSPESSSCEESDQVVTESKEKASNKEASTIKKGFFSRSKEYIASFFRR